MHESIDSLYWVSRQVSTDETIAPIGSVYYRIFKTGLTHSESTTFVTANLERAIATCDNMARVSSPAYRRAQSAVTRAEKSIRKNAK